MRYVSIILRGVGGAVAPSRMLGHPLPFPPHLLRTIALPSPYHRRYILGFRSEIRGCSGDGVELVRRWYGDGRHNMRAWRIGRAGLISRAGSARREKFLRKMQIICFVYWNNV